MYNIRKTRYLYWSKTDDSIETSLLRQLRDERNTASHVLVTFRRGCIYRGRTYIPFCQKWAFTNLFNVEIDFTLSRDFQPFKCGKTLEERLEHNLCTVQIPLTILTLMAHNTVRRLPDVYTH